MPNYGCNKASVLLVQSQAGYDATDSSIQNIWAPLADGSEVFGAQVVTGAELVTGATIVAGTWTNPPAVEPATTTWVPAPTFTLRIPQAARIAISKAKAATQGVGAAPTDTDWALADLYDRMADTRAQLIDVSDAEVIGAVQSLVTAGLITADQATAILAPVAA